MLTDLLPIVSSVMGVFAVMALGAFCRRCDWLSREADRSLANVTAYLLLPALFVDRILNSAPFDSLSVAWLPIVFGLATTAAGFIIGLLVARTFGVRLGLETDAKQRTFALCVGICNYGYIPFPLAIRFYPDAVIDLILHNVGVDMALWSVGVAVISGTATWRRALLGPPVLAVIFAVTMKQFGWITFIPEPVLTAIGMLSVCAIPMGLLLSGAIIVDYLRETDWAGSHRMIVASVAVRQLIMPTLMLTAAGATAISVDLKQVVMLQAAMPSAVFPIVIVRMFDRDTKTALRVVLSTSIAGIVLVPVWLAIGKWWLGV